MMPLLLDGTPKPFKAVYRLMVGTATISAGAAARTHMISTYGWTITDGGLFCSIYLPLLLK